MMNLPIKIVDLVTLLFLSLLVVIIIFIILQRNIKRFKLRNVKDPHFLACKSIPKDLKEAILRKHSLAHTYNEPGVLLTSNYTANCGPDEASTKTFLTRMKAFETSKHLEYALIEFGYRRPMSMKFEEFVDNLLKIEDDTLPKEMLREFSRFYLWAMLDPMKFDNVELRKLNRLINRIIENLASKKKPQQEQILQHKLDLNENGDYDFSKNKPFVVSTSRQQSVNNHHHHHHHKEPAIVKSKSVKFGGEANNSAHNNTNANNNTNTSIYSTSDILPFETATVHGKSLKEQAAKFAKSVFTGAKKSSGGSGGSDDGDDDHRCHLTAPTSATVSSSLLGYSKKSDAKYEEIKNTSIESGNGSSCEQKSSPIGENEPTTSTATTKNIVITNPWSTSLQDESLLLKPDDDDLENEKIPLVVRSGKGGTSAVSGGKHAKKSSSSTAEKQSSKATKKQKNSNEIELTGGESSKPSARVNETYEATC